MSARLNSAWQYRELAKPLVAWRSSQLASVAAALDEVVLAWSLDWGLAQGVAGRCQEAAKTDAEEEGWQLLGCSGIGAAWLQAGSAAQKQLAGELLGEGSAITPLACEVLAACRKDLSERLVRRCGLADSTDSSPAATAAAEPWGGSVLVSLVFGVRVLLDSRCVAGFAGASGTRPGRDLPRPALVPLDQAMADLPLLLQAKLDPCEIDVGSLQDLRIGDVVRLQHALLAPVAVEDAQGRQLFTGHLARSRGSKAVELAAPAP